MSDRPLRADAQRNRARVLAVAMEAFAAEGLAVPVHEIARRAGVGTGTVSRHFPTKEALFEAIVLTRVAQLVDSAETLAATLPPAEALFGFMAVMVREGGLDRGLSDALTSTGFDLEAAAGGAGHRVHETIEALLAAAVRAGEVRAGVDVADIKALIAGCLTRDTPEGRERMIAIVCDGLRAR